MPPRTSDSPPRSGRRRGRAREEAAGEEASEESPKPKSPRTGPRTGPRTAKKSGPRSKKSTSEEGTEKGGGKGTQKATKKPAGEKRGSKRSGGRASRSGPAQFHGPSLFDALTRRNAIILWLSSAALLFLICLYPVSDLATRGLGAFLFLALPLGLLALWWRYPVPRWGMMLVLLLLVGYWFLPGRTSFDRPELREETARALSRYQGTSFWRDGENRYGVDGPGLIRRSVIEATFIHGLRTLNPWLLRRSVAYWWADLSTRDLLPNARGTARRYTMAKSLHELNPAVLYPGDFVVSGDREHVLAYLGDQRWLFPDPESGRVILLDLRNGSHPVAEGTVSLMRWRILEAPRPNSVYLP